MEYILKEIKELKGIRKDFGDLTSLVESIRKIGLINPITISKNGIVIVGRRRRRAWEILHKKYPNQFNAFPPFIRHPLTYKELMSHNTANMFNMMQIHENTQRKDFTAEEIESIRTDIEEQRKAGKLPDVKGDTRDVVAEMVGVGGKTVDKITTIVRQAKKSRKSKEILAKLNKGQISVDTAFSMVTKYDRSLPKIDPPKGEYDLIYCDIPIGFDDDGVRGAAQKHYDTMPPETFLKMEVPSAKDCVIFFWIPSAFLLDGTARNILDAWGFYPKALFIWEKPYIGVGSWSRNQHENLIMAVKGNMPTPAVLYPTIIKAPKDAHSQKPDIIYEMIEKMYPKRTKIELFARNRRDGWDSHGNELDAHQFTTFEPVVSEVLTVVAKGSINESEAVTWDRRTGKVESEIEKLRRSKKK